MNKVSKSEEEIKESVWTLFWDMSSGGGRKEPPYDKIFIEAPLDEATSVFYSKFGHNPNRVTCTCCGEDYSISSGSIHQLTGYHRGLRSINKTKAQNYSESRYIEPNEEVPEGFKVEKRYGRTDSGMTLEAYLEQDNILVITADEYTEADTKVNVPDEGYVWM